MDWAVQKAVEIGVRRFLPLETERAQVRGAAVESRIEHWRRISLQALKQCRRAWAMEVGDVVAFSDLVEPSQRVGVVADREGSAIADLPEGVAHLLVVGPEGGFTAAERQLLERCGWPRLCLGPHILRAETAAIVGAAMMVARNEQSRVEG
jgi:16S rRNA (uracil1498-N3)-methyltransferase